MQFKESIISTPKGFTDDFEAGSYPARIQAVYRVGTQPNDHPQALKDTKVEVVFQFELVDEKITVDGKEVSRIKSKTFGDTLHKQGKLKPMVEMLGFSAESFDLVHLIGVPCVVNFVSYTKPDGTPGVKFASVGAPMKGMTVSEATIPPVFFDFNNNFSQEAVDQAPEWIQEKIKGAPEYAQAYSGTTLSGVAEAEPFPDAPAF